MCVVRNTLWAVWLLACMIPAATAQTLTVGYVELEDDPRYDRGRIDARIPGQPWGRPFAGAEVAAAESRFPLSTADVTLEFARETVASGDELGPALERLEAAGAGTIMLDLPGRLIPRALEATAGGEQILFNVTAAGNRLRGQACHPRLFHLAASDAIRMDGLAQYLIERRWRRVLVLQGPREADQRQFEAFRGAAERYGVEIVEVREFTRGSNPRQREANNLDLLTRGEGFDAIYVADSDGEFAQTVPYHARAPRPVIGAAGLIPVTWHWNWQRHGAPQLNNRFERHAERRMTQHDWAAWTGVKAIAEAVMRGGDIGTATLREQLRGDQLVLDGFQGYRLSFRPWNQQLRMAVFLSSPNWVVTRAPFEGFLHPENDLDSLGAAERESNCEM